MVALALALALSVALALAVAVALAVVSVVLPAVDDDRTGPATVALVHLPGIQEKTTMWLA